jgi:putative transposase
MTLYRVAGAGAPIEAGGAAPPVVSGHLPTVRQRRYPSDTTDAGWAVLAALVPAGGPGRCGGRRPCSPRREIVDAIRYVAHNGGVRRALPADFPPWQTVDDYHRRWSAAGGPTGSTTRCVSGSVPLKAANPTVGGDHRLAVGTLWCPAVRVRL